MQTIEILDKKLGILNELEFERDEVPSMDEKYYT